MIDFMNKENFVTDENAITSPMKEIRRELVAKAKEETKKKFRESVQQRIEEITTGLQNVRKLLAKTKTEIMWHEARIKALEDGEFNINTYTGEINYNNGRLNALRYFENMP